MQRMIALVLCLATATAALAHNSVRNAAVKARMQAMGVIGDNTKTLGDMSKGTTAFDAAKARNAAARIAQQAAQVPKLFEALETDPKSEALPVIWTQFAEFTAKAQDLEQVATVAAMMSTKAELQVALGEISGACQGCHKAYRK